MEANNALPIPHPTDDDDDDDDLAPPVPPDGGWGWVVVFASLVCNIVVDGVCFSFGVFLPTFLEYFKGSSAKTSFVGSLIPGMYLGMGPIVGALANKYGCRRVTIFGSVMAAVALFLSTFAPNLDTFIIIYGVFGGCGFGLMYLPAIVIVGLYFDKRRAFATGIAVCGSGIGTFLFAPFGKLLLDTYGWKGGHWIISSIVLMGTVCGALFRPLEAVSLRRLKPKRLRELRETPRGVIIERIIQEKNRNRTISTGSLDGCVITRDNMLIRSNLVDAGELRVSDECVMNGDPAKINKMRNMAARPLTTVEEEEDAAHSAESSTGYRPPEPLPAEKAMTNIDLTSDAADATASQSSQVETPKPDKPTSSIEVSRDLSALDLNGTPVKPAVSNENAVTKSLTLLTMLDAPLIRDRSYTESRRPNANRVSRTGVKVVLATDPSRSNPNVIDRKIDLRELRAKEASRPMNRKDVFYTGSVHSLREYKQNPDMASYIASHASIPPPTDTQTPEGGCYAACSVLKEMLDITLLKSPTFILLCITSVLAMTGFFTPFVYISDYANKMGVPDVKATLLLSVLGGSNTIGRIISGFISDRPWADCLLIHNLALVIAGIVTCFLPLCKTFPLLVIYCFIFGSCIAAFITLRSIVLVELLGLDKLTSSFGLLLAFQGLAALIGSPIAGAIYDQTKSYTMSFIVAGVLIALAGLIALPVRTVAAWEARRTQQDTECLYSIVDDEQDSPD